MTRFVIDPGVALRIAREETAIAPGHKLVAPALLRSQLVSMLYTAARRGETTRNDTDVLLDRVRALQIRLLGDRVLQKNAWSVADRLGWPDTFTAEYVALTRLQADAFVTLEAELAVAVRDEVPVAPFDALTTPAS